MSFLSKFGFIEGQTGSNSSSAFVFETDLNANGNDLTNIGTLQATTGVFDNITVSGQSDLQGNIVNTAGDVTINDNLHVTGDLTVDGILNYTSLNPPIVPGMTSFTVTSSNPLKINTSTNTETVTDSETVNISLAPSGVTANTYTNPSSVTVTSEGLISSIVAGSAPVVPSTKSIVPSANFTSTGDASFYGPNATNLNIDLSNTGITAGTYTGANVTTDVKGRITGITAGSVRPINSGTGITVSGSANCYAPNTLPMTVTLNNTAVVPNTYGNSGTDVASFQVDAQGRIVSASNVPISFPANTALDSIPTRNWKAATGSAITGGQTDSVAIGNNALASGNSVSIGSATGSSTMVNTVAIGTGSGSTATSGSTVVGFNSRAILNDTVIGSLSGSALTTGSQSNTFIGRSAGTSVTTGTGNTLLGANSNALPLSNRSVAIGESCVAPGQSNVCVGSLIQNTNTGINTGDQNVLIGNELAPTLTGPFNNNVLIGYRNGLNQRAGSGNVSIGQSAGVGASASAVSQSNTVSIGNLSYTKASQSTVVGYNSFANLDCVGFGPNVGADGDTSICVGSGSSANLASTRCITIGSGAINGLDNTVIGHGNTLNTGSFNTVIGNTNSNTATVSSNVVGRANNVSGAGFAQCFGAGNLVSASNAISVGSNNNVTGNSAIAIGNNINNSVDNSTIIGGSGAPTAHVVNSTGFFRSVRQYSLQATNATNTNYTVAPIATIGISAANIDWNDTGTIGVNANSLLINDPSALFHIDANISVSINNTAGTNQVHQYAARIRYVNDLAAAVNLSAQSQSMVISGTGTTFVLNFSLSAFVKTPASIGTGQFVSCDLFRNTGNQNTVTVTNYRITAVRVA